MNIALIVAGGSGTRFGGETPKQFLLIDNKPLLAYTIEAFNKVKNIDQIVLVVPKEYINEVKKYKVDFNLSKISKVVEGGTTRQESVKNGLLSINCNDEDIILIHDGARPLINEDIIAANIQECSKYQAVETVIPMVDTVIKSEDGTKLDSVKNRNELYQVQTPQTFKYSLIKKAHLICKDNLVSDDAQLIKNMGINVHLVIGSRTNIKITNKEDLELFKSIKK